MDIEAKLADTRRRASLLVQRINFLESEKKKLLEEAMMLNGETRILCQLIAEQAATEATEKHVEPIQAEQIDKGV